MVSLSGLKASELIKKLEVLIRWHGDQDVFLGGGDYPEGVSGVTVEPKGDGYVPKGAFRLH